VDEELLLSWLPTADQPGNGLEIRASAQPLKEGQRLLLTHARHLRVAGVREELAAGLQE
jgi:hypothetical protein